MPGPRTSTKRERANRDMITYPLRGVRALLLAHKRGESELNLASAYRQLEWCRSTYEHVGGRLGIFHDEVIKLFKEVEDEVDSFNFSEARHTEDLYSIALRHYEDCDLLVRTQQPVPTPPPNPLFSAPRGSGRVLAGD